MGRQRVNNLPFEEAREVCRAERIQSVKQYGKWHNLNKPAGLPRRPDRAYKKEWISWNDFLGNNTPFPVIRVKYRSFNEARAFAQSLNIHMRKEWFDICDQGKKPHDIPRRPDMIYRKKNEWISWGNFLGVNLESKMETIRNTNTIFFIIFNPKADKNYFKCGITNGGISSINDFLQKINGKVVCKYYVPSDFNVNMFMESVNASIDYENTGYYYIPDLTPAVSKLSMNFNRV